MKSIRYKLECSVADNIYAKVDNQKRAARYVSDAEYFWYQQQKYFNFNAPVVRRCKLIHEANNKYMRRYLDGRRKNV